MNELSIMDDLSLELLDFALSVGALLLELTSTRNQKSNNENLRYSASENIIVQGVEKIDPAAPVEQNNLLAKDYILILLIKPFAINI